MDDIEAIKQLKARYCRFLDTKQWDDWRALFIDAYVSDTSAGGGKVTYSADEFVAFTRDFLGKPTRITVHQVHCPEIELTSPTEARGVWALNDVVRLAPFVNMRGYGHYHETYVKEGDEWRLASCRLTRLREDLFNGFFSIRIPEWLRDAMGAVARRVHA